MTSFPSKNIKELTQILLLSDMTILLPSLKLLESQAWLCMPVIPTLRKLRQKDCEFKASLGYKISKKLS
jgi:hypothetical protein